MKKYSNVMNTNVTWIPQIPAHWKLQKINALFTERKKKVSDKDYKPLSVTKKGILPQLAHAAKSNDSDNRKLVKAGDFVINSRSDRKGSCGVSKLDGSVSLINIVLTPRNELNSEYIHYLLRNYRFSEEYYRNGRGIVADLWTTRYSEMRTILIPVPPRAEQDQIVRFLDWKVSEINKLIGIRRKEIQELEELKAEIINSAILQGIDSNVVMKKTDVYYLPKIPATWKVIKIKRICKVGASISNQLKKHTDQDKVVFLPMENISENGKIDCSIKQPIAKVRTGFSSFAKNDVIVAKITPCFENGKGACLDELESDIGYGTTELFNLRAGNDVLPKYLYYITMTKIFRSLGEGQMTGSAGQKRVPADFIRNFVIGLPSIAIQYKIIDYICLKTSQINRLICTKHKQLEFLKELCSTIISDVVTGKIDVRNIPVPAYEHVDDLTADDGEDNDEETGIPGEED
ncbi:restriction endonuclease subunit S [Megasphaera sp.]|jgi:type I restriction enzyme, S subunit|uniref:restriction endonuclease subunit S n=1 Tax=Megasphaera sp. TaxID=2023260 RepID=UPI003A5B9514